MGVKQFIATGTTPYPDATDTHLPHVVARLNRQIAKTALGAEKNISIRHGDINKIINEYRNLDYHISALEQADISVDLRNYQAPNKLILIVGSETEGVEKAILDQCDTIIEIPMLGQKESFNVASAAAMALWQLSN